MDTIRRNPLEWSCAALAVLVLLVASCVAGCAAPTTPIPTPPAGPSTPWQPAPPPVEDAPEHPLPDTPAPDELAAGMSKSAVVALLGPPYADPPENPGEADTVRWVVTEDGVPRLMVATFDPGLILPVQWRERVHVE